MIENRFIRNRFGSLHYVIAGQGRHPLIFFHGFGQDHSIYLPLIHELSNDYRLFIFDIYFHGGSEWHLGEQPLEKSEWSETIRSFLTENHIENFSLVGFSLGGKFALATAESFPDRIEKLFLIAPDGISTSFWYSMATYPILFRKFFRSMIDSYPRFQRFASLLNMLKLVDKGLIRFADYQMGTKEKRRRVYYSWVVFRHLKFEVRRLATLLNQYRIDTTVIVGRYDKVIVAERIQRFVERLEFGRLKVLESGHNGLIYESLPHLHRNDNRHGRAEPR